MDRLACRWFITRAAVDDYRRAVARDMDDDQALIELCPLAERAHQVKLYPDGRELWRGRALNRRRLRLIVGPPRREGDRPALVAVLDEYDGASKEHRAP